MAEELSYRALCSVADVDQAMQLALVPGDPRTDLVTRLINAASTEIYSFTDREFIAGTKDYYDADEDSEIRVFDVSQFGLGANVIEIGDLMQAPILVTINNFFGVVMSETDAVDYDLFPRVRREGEPFTFLRFHRSWLYQDYNVAITGKWGWSAIPNDVRNACIDITSLAYDRINLHSGTVEQEMQGNQPTRLIPPHTIASLNKYRRLRA